MSLQRHMKWSVRLLITFVLQVEGDDIVVQKVTSIRSASHCLQLAVKDAYQELQGFFEKCRGIIRDIPENNTARPPTCSTRYASQVGFHSKYAGKFKKIEVLLHS